MAVNRLNDVFFKSLMGDERRKNLTLSFLNAVLFGEETRFKDVRFSNKELVPEQFGDKFSALDVLATMDDGTRIDVEVQVADEHNIQCRTLYYGCRLYGTQLSSGEMYQKLKPAIVISLCNFVIFKQAEYEKYHTIRKFKDINNEREIDTEFNDLSIHFIELPKLRISDVKQLKRAEKWAIYFSGKASDEEMSIIAENEPGIKEAMSYEQEFFKDKGLSVQYEMREKALRDYNSGMYAAMQEGEARGLAKGKQEGRIEGMIIAAQNMLADGMPIDAIRKYTNLDTQEILSLMNRQAR